MKKYSRAKIDRLKRAREAGKSILDLMAEFSMPKTSIWNHTHDIELTDEAKNKIKSKQGGSKRRSERAWEEARKQSSAILKSKYRLFYTIIAMLYWAEGNKKGFVFTNTDGKMINLFIFILEHYLGIKKEDIKITIRIFSNLNKKECVHYWSDITKTPEDRIIIYMNDGGARGKAQFGICRLTLKNGGYYHKLVLSLADRLYRQVVTPR